MSKKHLLLVLLTAVCSLSAQAQDPAARPSSSVEARIRRVEEGLLPPNVIAGQPGQGMKLLERMKAAGTPGLTIAVINDYKIEWVRSYGTKGLETAEPVTPDTMYQVASISKPVTSAAAMQLVEQGVLSLDEDVNRKLRSWKVPENEFTRTHKVTLRTLLMHTAGFQVMEFRGTPHSQASLSTVDLLEGRYPGAVDGAIRVRREPGSRYEYSGANFIVLQQLLEDVTGETFPSLMKRRVLDRAGMSSSTFEQRPDAALRSRMSPGTQELVAVKDGWLLKPNMASGGLWSTAGDIARFIIQIQNGFAGRANNLLRPDTIRQMIPARESRQGINVLASLDEVNRARGVGLEVGGEGATLHFGHGGNNVGFRSEMIALPDGRGLVILTNGNSQALLREIVRAVATEYNWNIPNYVSIRRTVVPVPEATLNRYAGAYDGIGAVSVRDGQLVIAGFGVQAEAPNRFFNSFNESTYSFVENGEGVMTLRWEVPPGFISPIGFVIEYKKR